MAAKDKHTRKKQTTCSHPSRHVHPTIDARFETCDLCHVIQRAPINPPWIVAYDEAQPAPAIPLFADYDPPEEGEPQ